LDADKWLNLAPIDRPEMMHPQPRPKDMGAAMTGNTDAGMQARAAILRRAIAARRRLCSFLK
jgi:hypothetical protein